jgi:DNA polymerase II small subunit
MTDINIKKELVNYFLEKNLLLSPDFFNQKEINQEKIDNLIQSNLDKQNLLLMDQNIINILEKNKSTHWLEFDKSKVLFEKGINKKIYERFIEFKEPESQIKQEFKSNIKILFSYNEESKKRDVQDFVAYFNARYKLLEKMLSNRQELQNIMSINRILNKKDKENISIIGIIKDKRTTKAGNIMLEAEDPTGIIKVLISKNKPDLHERAKDIVLDEVIGIVGVNSEKIIFANNILWPEIPLKKEFKKSPEESYVIFLSDLHVGSKNFLPNEFNKFLQWINGEVGNEAQRNIAKKVKYIFIIGDLVDGCGIYPEQDEELIIKDIYQQYEECAKLLKKIPQNIKIIISPGNHDAMRMAEPQLELYKDFSKPLWDLPNAVMVSNPALINIEETDKFPGFDILIYHGYSFDYYIANVESIRNKGGYDRADLIMKFLLQRRHLAPTHTSTLYIPDVNRDPLVIDKVPDFFVTGHIHKSIAANYRNITMICGSCWQSKTSFQEKVGHNPEPARVPIVNLQTREVKILKFGN